MAKNIKVRYVGLKEAHSDHLYGTNQVWIGNGDTQEVPIDVWPKFAQHPDVYELVADNQKNNEAALAVQEKTALIEKVKALGHAVDGRTSVARLEELLALAANPEDQQQTESDPA